jgi:hypothetical protein
MRARWKTGNASFKWRSQFGLAMHVEQNDWMFSANKQQVAEESFFLPRKLSPSR